jgi:hypothetical protein
MLRKVKLGLHTYPITWVDGPIPDDEGNPTLAGQIQHSGTRRIRVSKTDSIDMRETLLHECLHGIFVDRDLDVLTHDADAAEHLVSSLSRGLLAALRENKGLAEFLIG